MSHTKSPSKQKSDDPIDLLAEAIDKDKTTEKITEKNQVTLYMTPELHRTLKITSVISSQPMSALAEKAIKFYLEHGDIIETNGYGHTHRLHQCPECHHHLVFRKGNLEKINSSAVAIDEPLNEGDLIHR